MAWIAKRRVKLRGRQYAPGEEIASPDLIRNRLSLAALGYLGETDDAAPMPLPEPEPELIEDATDEADDEPAAEAPSMAWTRDRLNAHADALGIVGAGTMRSKAEVLAAIDNAGP